jgi:hypothetical protein
MGSRGGNLTDLMQAQFSNGNKLPFGPNMGSGVVDWATVHTRWVTTAIKAGLVKDGHPKTITIDVMTSLGHLCDVIGLRANFVVEIDKEKLRTHLTNFAKVNGGITEPGPEFPFPTPDGKDPFWGLENVNFLPNMFRQIIEEWIMRHNGAEVDHKDTRQLNLMGMDQYFKEEAKYYAVLMNGREESKLKHDGVGGPKYIYYDEVRQRWAQKNHNALSTTKADPNDPTSGLFYTGYNPAVNIRPCEPMDMRVYKPQLEELAQKSIDKDVHAVYDQYYSDLFTVLGIRDLSRQKYQRKNTAAVPASGTGGVVQPALMKGKPLFIVPNQFNDAATNGTKPIYSNYPKTTLAGGSTVDNVPVMKTIDDIVDILGGEKFTFPMEYVLQTVFHRHMKDAIDILNFVNNPEFEITFKYFGQWIQNFAEVGGFVSLKLENFEVVTRYHDVTRAVWDREFHGRGQHTRPLVDFQWHHNNFTAKFTAGGHPGGDDVKGKTIVHKIWPQNLDNIVRMVYILIQSREHFDKLNDNNIAHKYFDILESVEWKINGEVFGKKTMDDVDQKVRTNFHYTKKKSHSVTRDQTWVHNMSFDMDMNNYKGGTINLLPIANNNEWVLTFSIPKLIALYNSQFAEAAYLSLADIDAMRVTLPATSPVGLGADHDWTPDMVLNRDGKGLQDLASGDEIVKGSMFRTSVGSHQGGIRRTKVANFDASNPQYDYEVNLFIALQCHVPNIYMQQDGQTHAVRRLPGKA